MILTSVSATNVAKTIIYREFLHSHWDIKVKQCVTLTDEGCKIWG